MDEATSLDKPDREKTDGARGFEFPFTPKDFARVRSMILARAGISLAPHKQNMVYSRLAKRVRSLGYNNFKDYLDFLQQGETPEWQEFVNSLTTNLTSFFREPHHFEILHKYLLHVRERKPQVTIWCSASSTGEEPYTIAMTAIDAFESDHPPVRIIATDIDTQVLEAARRGVYRMDAVQGLPIEVLRRHFQKGKGAQEGYARVKPALQKLITFQRLNLLDTTWPITGPFDAIFCRNVMIYFERDVQLGILQRFHPLMSKKGLLFAGHSENLAMAKDWFELRGKTVYQRVETQG